MKPSHYEAVERYKGNTAIKLYTYIHTHIQTLALTHSVYIPTFTHKQAITLNVLFFCPK